MGYKKKIRKILKEHSAIKHLGYVKGIAAILVLFIFNIIFNEEISSLWGKAKENFFRNMNSDYKDYFELFELGMENENELKYERAIEYYSGALNMLHENENIEIAKCNIKIGYSYLQIGDIIMAISYKEKAKSILVNIQLTEENYLDICNINSEIAAIEIACNEYQEALDIYKKTEKIFDNMNDIESKDRALLYTELAELYYKLGELPNAILYVEKACKMIEVTSGSASLNTARVYQSVCLIYSDIDYEKARTYGVKSYRIILKYETEKPLYMISICQTLSYLYSNVDVQKSYEFALKRNKYCKTYLGEINVETILSEVYLAQYEDAASQVLVFEELYRKITSIYGENSVESAIVCHNLANAYLNIYMHYKAKVLYNECLSIYMKLLSETHPYVAEVYNDLALCAQDEGDYLNQIKYIEKALDIYQKRYGEMYPEIAALYLQKGNAEFEYSGNYNRSLRLYEKAKNIYIELYGENSVCAAECYAAIANIYISLGTPSDLNEAGRLILSCIKIYEEELGITNISVIKLLIVYAQILYYKENFESAISQLNRALDICKLYDRENSPFAVTIYYLLGLCYYQKEDFDNATSYAQRTIETIRINYTYVYTVVEYSGAYCLLALCYSNSDIYKKATIDTIKEALDVIPQINNDYQIYSIYYDAATVYYNLGEKEIALRYVDNAYSIVVELYGVNNDMAMLVLELRAKILDE